MRVVTMFIALTIALPVSAQAITFKHGDGKLLITAGEAPIASYVYQDAKLPRPYFAHVHAPGKLQVTRNHLPIASKDATDHADMHPGIWLAFGDLSGADSWRLKARVRHDKFIDGPKDGRFTVRNLYLATDGKTVICSETCRITIPAEANAYLLTWDSEFRGDADFSFGDQEEMGLGIRVATPMTVKAGGTILTSDGHKNEKQVRGKTSAWCDYAGTIDGKRVGITLMQHPKNFRPAWYHARDYGLLVANPFGCKALTGGETSRITVKAGETLRLRYGILLHAGDTSSPDAYKRYLDLAK